MSHNPIPVRCRAFLNDFSAFVDGELPPRRRDEIQAHVDCCQACLDHLTAYRRGITVLRSIEADCLADAEQLDLATWRSRPRWHRSLEGIARLADSLM